MSVFMNTSTSTMAEELELPEIPKNSSKNTTILRNPSRQPSKPKIRPISKNNF